MVSRAKAGDHAEIEWIVLCSSNMYSHVLAAYQKTLLLFWAKTSKTMTAIAESFKGYQYYEFTVIKDLAEPNRLLAERSSSAFTDKIKDDLDRPTKSASERTDGDDTLIDITESTVNEPQGTSMKTMRRGTRGETVDGIEPISSLIDISDAQLDDQLLELEKLTTIDHAAVLAANTKTTPSASDSGDNLVDLLQSAIDHEKLFSDLLSPMSPLSRGTTLSSDALKAGDDHSFEADWTAAFGRATNQQQLRPSDLPDDTGASNDTFLPASLLNELLAPRNNPSKPTHPKPKPSTATTKANEKSNWFDLFAELDPIQNPDAIGKSVGTEADRNC